MTKDVQLSARVSRPLSIAIEKIAEAQGRSKSWVVEKALENYVENEADFIAKVQEGLADSKAGRTVPFAKVEAELNRRFAKRRRK